jgi:hypothetical protein
MTAAALLDLDGTLIDSNYQHALAWYRALLRYEIVVPVWRVHRHIGMGATNSLQPSSARRWSVNWGTTFGTLPVSSSARCGTSVCQSRAPANSSSP